MQIQIQIQIHTQINTYTNTDTDTNTNTDTQKGDSIVTETASICIRAHTNIWLPSFQREGQID